MKYWKNQSKVDFFKLKIWSEIPTKCGLNSSGALSACLSCLLYMLKNKIGYEEMQALSNKWKEITINELKNDNIFSAIFKNSWIIEDCFPFKAKQ